ncbi:HMG-box [Hesseltinella vesiculosa]|uniref:HMG-box n=1 Tax=Hesseltinella vesiculosa TaxID=101127 RepID=A0A1X2G3A3_9FUNG|nr:HMG-box [Hesseltinella vesiculosa]
MTAHPANNKELVEAFRKLGESFIHVSKLLKETPVITEVHGKRKRTKDVNAPKKNISSYLHFVMASRDRVIQDNPGLNQIEIAKVLGKQWTGLTEEDKEQWKKQANKDKQRYEKEMEEYLSPNHATTTDGTLSSQTHESKKKHRSSEPESSHSKKEKKKSSKKEKKHKK